MRPQTNKRRLFISYLRDTLRPGQRFMVRQVADCLESDFSTNSVRWWCGQLRQAGCIEWIGPGEYRVIALPSAEIFTPEPLSAKMAEAGKTGAIGADAEHKAWLASCALARQQRQRFNPWERA